MRSMICDRSQKGNAKFTSKMERLPILREDDKVVWNWWCVVWFIGHCHGNKNYQFFRSRSTLCFIFQTISLNITSVPWLEHKKKWIGVKKNRTMWTGCICRHYVWFPIHGQYQIHLWSPQDSPERFLQLIWRWRVTLERKLPFGYACILCIYIFIYIYIEIHRFLETAYLELLVITCFFVSLSCAPWNRLQLGDSSLECGVRRVQHRSFLVVTPRCAR